MSCCSYWFLWSILVILPYAFACKKHEPTFNCTALEACPPSRVICGSLTVPNSTDFCECKRGYLWLQDDVNYPEMCGYKQISSWQAAAGSIFSNLRDTLVIFGLLLLFTAMMCNHDGGGAYIWIALSIAAFLFNVLSFLSALFWGAHVDSKGCPPYE